MTKQFMQNYARKTRARKSFATKVKRTVLKLSETKYKSLDINASTNQFDGEGTYQANYHRIFQNSGTRFRLWSDETTSTNGIWPSQGETDANREGDRIYCTGIKIRGSVSFAPNLREAIVKAWYVPYNDLQGEPYSNSEFFHNVSGNQGLWPLSPIQTKRWPGARYLGTIKPPTNLNQSPTDGDPIATGKLFSWWIPMKKKVFFLKDNVTTTSGLPQNGVIVMYAYSYGNTVTTTAISGVEMHATLYWKDL
jgi:hypothetical protein